MKVMSIDLGLSKRSEKEEQMATYSDKECCSEEECCVEERTLLSEIAEDLCQQINTAHQLLDQLLGSRPGQEKEKYGADGLIAVAHVRVTVAHEGMSELLARLDALAAWFIK